MGKSKYNYNIDISDIDAVYLASILDNHGVFKLVRCTQHQNGRPYDVWQSMITIKTTHWRILDICKKILGDVTPMSGKKETFHAKKKSKFLFYSWHISGTRLDYILAATSPFMIKKYRQAILIKHFRETLGANGISESLKELRKELIEEMREIGKKGSYVVNIQKFRSWPEEYKLSYVGGLIDVDGTSKLVYRSLHRRVQVRTSFRISKSKNKPMIDLLNEFFPGVIWLHKTTKVFSWIVSGKRIDELLRIFGPYVKLKHKEFDLIKQFRNTLPDSECIQLQRKNIVEEFDSLMQEQKKQ